MGMSTYIEGFVPPDETWKKMKNVYNTVKSVTTNPHTMRTAFTFEEDDSIVNAHICNLRKTGKEK